MWQSWWGGPLVLDLVLAGPPGPALRSRNQDPGIGDSPARGPAADRAGVRISARRDLAAELPVRRSVLDGNRQILGDQPGAISHQGVSGASVPDCWTIGLFSPGIDSGLAVLS